MLMRLARRSVASMLVLLVTVSFSQAADGFSKLAKMLPRSANTIVLLNVNKAISSPLGRFEGWDKSIEKSFEAGISRVPSSAVRFILAAEMDFDFMKPLWEVAVIESSIPISTAAIAKKRHGQTDTVESYAAVSLPEDVYLIQFDETTLAGIGPANRKLAVNWLRDMKAGLKLSPYLEKAANYSDRTGSEIIVAADLDGAFGLEKVVAYLKQKPAVVSGDVNIQKAAKFLTSIKGMRLGIRLTQPPTAAIAVDYEDSAKVDAAMAKDAFLQVLADGGLLLPEMREWKCTVKDFEVSMNGTLSKEGLRRVLSLVDSPTSSQPEVATSQAAEGNVTSADPKKQMGDATLKQFRAVTKMFDDLKGEMKDAGNLAVTAVYFDRYAKRIERLPILDVDPAMLDYNSYVASSLRNAANAVRTMGIRGSSRQAQINYSDIDYDYAYGYRAGWYGAAGYAVPVNDGVNTVQAVEAERRKIRAEEKGIAATDVHAIRREAIDATNAIRRKMTEKYRMEF